MPFPSLFLTYAVGTAVLAAVYGAAVAPGRTGAARALRLAVLLAGCGYVVYQLGFFLPRFWDAAGTRPDGLNYYVTARRASAGEALYRPWPDYGPHYATAAFPYPWDRHPYPPFLTAVLVPLAGLPAPEFGRALYLAVVPAFWAYAATLAKLATGVVRPAGVLAAGLALGLMPGAHLALQLANVEPVLWALFGAALAFPALRGFGFTASAMVKLYCAWPLLLALKTEGRRVALSAAAALALGAVAGCLALGPARFFGALWDWTRYFLPVLGQGTFHVDTRNNGINLSIPMAGLRLARHLGWWEYAPGPLPGWARLYLTALGVAAPVLAAWWTRRAERTLRYALVTLAAVVFAPLFWTTYLPLFLAPLAILAGRRSGVHPR
jgi:hypothetical protein